MSFFEMFGLGAGAVSIALLLVVFYLLRKVYLVMHRNQFLEMPSMAPKHEAAFYRYPSKPH